MTLSSRKAVAPAELHPSGSWPPPLSWAEVDLVGAQGGVQASSFASALESRSVVPDPERNRLEARSCKPESTRDRGEATGPRPAVLTWPQLRSGEASHSAGRDRFQCGERGILPWLLDMPYPPSWPSYSSP